MKTLFTFPAVYFFVWFANFCLEITEFFNNKKRLGKNIAIMTLLRTQFLRKRTVRWANVWWKSR